MSEAKVIFDYDAEADDELTLKEGDLIRNIEKKEDGWWEGDLHGKRGMFPENFVEEIKKPAAEIKNTAPEVKPGPDKTVMNDKSSMAKVTFDYDAENEDELSLKEGDMVKVIDQEEEGWWKGELNGKIGVFPSNFVELVKGPVPRTADLPVVPPEPEPPKEPVTGEKKAKMMGGMGMGINLDALSKVKLKKSANSGSAGNNISSPKAEKPSEPSEFNKRISMKRNPPKIPDSDRPPKPPPSRVKERVIVEFDYDGEQSDELSLRVGEVVTILEKDVNEGWSKGELNGKVGLFPDNFVKLLPPEQPKKDPEMTKSKSTSDLPKKPPLPVSDDNVDAKPSRPEFPKLKKTTADRPPPPSSVNQNEVPVKLKPVSNPPDDITKKSEPPPLPDSKPSEDKPKPPIKKSPPSLPKKPDKPRPQDLALTPERPPTVMRHLNGMDKDPNKRYSAAVTPSEKPYDVNLKRHSQGADLGVNLNDIKSSAVLQPLTSDRPKNPARNPPTKYGKPHSPVKKTATPEIPHASWPPKEDKEPPKKPVPEKPVEKPPKPALPETTKPPPAKPSESKVDSAEVKKLHEELNTLKNSIELLSKQFSEHVQKSEKQLQKMERKFTNEIDDLTKELDEEKKLRSAVDVEVNRLRKLIKNQLSP